MEEMSDDPIILASPDTTELKAVDPVEPVSAPQPPIVSSIYAARYQQGNTYYSYINWPAPFDQWRLVRIATPLDGSCLFHAISNSYFRPYQESKINGKDVPRRNMVASLRHDLAEMLSDHVGGDTGPIYYETLNNGQTAAFGREAGFAEFTLEYMKDQLKSHNPIGYGYMEFIGNVLDKDIYLLDALRRDIYNTDDLQLTIKGTRNAIILYYMEGHYELVGLQASNGSIDTYFGPGHSLIRMLYARVQSILAAKSVPTVTT